jgi:hypothetical protein
VLADWTDGPSAHRGATFRRDIIDVAAHASATAAATSPCTCLRAERPCPDHALNPKTK